MLWQTFLSISWCVACVSGKHPNCPLAPQVKNGSPCLAKDVSSGCQGECYSGACAPVHTTACASYGPPCDHQDHPEGNECVPLCKQSSGSTKCLAIGASCPVSLAGGMFFSKPASQPGCPTSTQGSLFSFRAYFVLEQRDRACSMYPICALVVFACMSVSHACMHARTCAR